MSTGGGAVALCLFLPFSFVLAFGLLFFLAWVRRPGIMLLFELLDKIRVRSGTACLLNGHGSRCLQH